MIALMTSTIDQPCLLRDLLMALGMTEPIEDEENERYYDGEDEFIDKDTDDDDFVDDDDDDDDEDEDEDDVDDDDLG